MQRFLYRAMIAFSGLMAGAWAADVTILEEIVAKVNGDIVTRSELERSRLSMAAEIRQRAKGPEAEALLQEKEKDLLRDKIDSLLLIQKAKELSINVDPEVSKQLADIQKDAAKTDITLADPDKFQAYVKQNTGMSYEDYKSEIRNQMMTQRVVRQEVGGRINIPKQEVAKYYEEHKAEFQREEQMFLREIFVSTEGKDAAGQAAGEKKAKDLVARAKKGERFGELARDNSDARTAAEFGDLGAMKKGDLREDLEAMVWTKDKGFVTDPIKLPNGFLILRVEERHKAGQAQLEEVESEIMERLYMPRFQPKIREFLTQLRQDAFLEIKEGFVDSSAAPGKKTAWTDPAQLKPETVTKQEVASNPRRKRLMWMVPIPLTSSVPKSSSK
ncbi:MAG: peptidylprolyl isomerase [Acidobacteriia bacterium]|nr:peptidylprolyl isomerase [Terriglobia bacterium]